MPRLELPIAVLDACQDGSSYQQERRVRSVSADICVDLQPSDQAMISKAAQARTQH